MTDLTATAATLNAVFTKAAPGDVLKLSGLFALAVLQGRVFDPPLTVDASGATLQAAVIKGVAGLRWTGGTFATLTRGRDAVNVSASQGITVERLSVTGDGTAGAVSFRDCQDVALTDSQIEGPRVGASLYNVARAPILQNAWARGRRVAVHGVAGRRCAADPGPGAHGRGTGRAHRRASHRFSRASVTWAEGAGAGRCARPAGHCQAGSRPSFGHRTSPVDGGRAWRRGAPR